MSLIQVQFNATPSLGKMTSATVIVPDHGDGPFPVLYLLHGLSDDNTAWSRRTVIEQILGDAPLIVVMPNGERGWYTDAVSRPNSAYESAIVLDLIGFVDRTFRTIPTASGRAVAGLSMGGYGAMKLGLKHPDLFCALVSFSGALARGYEEVSRDWPFYPELIQIFGPASRGSENDLHVLASRLYGDKRPDIYFDCGVDDFLIESNRDFDRYLTEIKVPHTFAEFPGGHNWEYWNIGIARVLPRLRRALGIAAETSSTGE